MEVLLQFLSGVSEVLELESSLAPLTSPSPLCQAPRVMPLVSRVCDWGPATFSETPLTLGSLLNVHCLTHHQAFDRV